MGGCCSKDGDGWGKRPDGAFHEIGGGLSADHDWGDGYYANGKPPPQSIGPSDREKGSAGGDKEDLLVLHAEAKERSRRRTSYRRASDASGRSVDEFGNSSIASIQLPADPTCSIVLAPQVRHERIHAAHIDISSDFVAPVHEKTDDEAAFIAKSLEGNFIFSDLGVAATKTLVDAFEKLHVPSSEEVIKQGEVGDYFYIIEKGSVTFTVDGSNVGTAHSGDSFGELALLYDCPRAATCNTSDNCALWRIDQLTFRSILASDSINNDNETRELLRKVPFLEHLDSEALMRFAEALTTVTYEPGEVIIRKGDEGKVFYVIKSGQVKVTDIEVGQSVYDEHSCGPGGYFGERALVTKEKRVANVTAMDKVTLFCLSKDDFNKVLGDFDEVMWRCNEMSKLLSMPLFARSGVTEHEAATLASMMKDVEYPAGHVFRSEGQILDDSDQRVCIIRSGKVTRSTKKGQIHILTSGGYFGATEISEEEEADRVVAKATVKATEACEVGVLTMADIETVLGSLSRLLKVKPGESRPTKLDTSIKMEDLKKHKILGAGSFGKVWLVSRDVAGATETMALKIQSKRELIGHNQVDAVVREKNIMASIDSPFIIKLFNAYQDGKCLYMLMQLVQGGELFDVVHREDGNGIPESTAKFYAAGILEGLAYMHRRHIIYRDLKPENVLIDKNGYPLIIDLGFAKIVEDKTYTLCGTPLYLAPEVILNRGHDKGADYWSWGILVYEMIVGLTPFYEDNIEQLALLKKIVIGRYELPTGRIDKTARDLVRKLLSRSPLNRLGCLAGAEKDIKQHEWFGDIDFVQLEKREMRAPWLPKVAGMFDSSNFDDHSHLQYRRDRSQPLSASEQELFRDF